MGRHDDEPLPVHDADEVPEGLLTEAELAALPEPREPGGDAVALLRRVGGHESYVPLYALRNSRPSVFLCGDCGAITEQRCQWSDNRPQCRACRQIASILQAQRDAQAMRGWVIGDVRGRLADPRLAVVAVRLVMSDPGRPGLGPGRGSGRSVPVAAYLEAVDGSGQMLLKVCTWLVPPSPAEGPDEAILPEALPADEAAALMRSAFAGRRLAFWSTLSMGAVHRAGQHLGVDFGLDLRGGHGALDGGVLGAFVAKWRCDVDPVSCRLVTPAEPTDALVLLDLMRQIAATPPPDEARRVRHHQNLARHRQAVQIAVTGRPGAVRRIGAVLAATGMLADDGYTADERPTQPSAHLPGYVTAHLPGIAHGADEA
ncbi:hypothetical protein [Yinghuangia soli]|uniref:Uncharacterized protein n=1 Tax=Yinghuangia soli TaxID=2908204 RepID=A0AA41PUB7_9ACTN|nr:hypothetical protein [Yinghuangia soli]MCF2525851.1 hypothetical protein [Yinghuangia soli]